MHSRAAPPAPRSVAIRSPHPVAESAPVSEFARSPFPRSFADPPSPHHRSPVSSLLRSIRGHLKFIIDNSAGENKQLDLDVPDKYVLQIKNSAGFGSERTFVWPWRTPALHRAAPRHPHRAIRIARPSKRMRTVNTGRGSPTQYLDGILGCLTSSHFILSAVSPRNVLAMFQISRGHVRNIELTAEQAYENFKHKRNKILTDD